MCWITLSPTKGKHHHGHHSHSEDGSSAEELVRVTRVGDRQRYSRVTIKAPTALVPEHHHHDHHGHLHPHLHHKHHHHIHPLHLHPMHGHHHHHFGLHHHHHHSPKLHGHGRKISIIPPVPPPTRSPSHCRSTPRSRSHSRSKSPCAPPSKEPMYRTQIVEPAEVRETTRIALREIRPDRPKGRLRRVAGYEVLGREVPWAWDCVSSVADSGTTVRGRRKGGSLRYPPFGTLDRWM